MNDSLKKKEKKKAAGLSLFTKFWIGLSLILFSIALICLAVWYLSRALFPDNPRLILSEIRVEGASGYWGGNNSAERDDRSKKLAKLLGLEIGTTNLFQLDLKDLREKLLRTIPEIEKARVYRVLPDLLVFDIVERIPRASLGRGLLVDENGVIMDQRMCMNLKGSLPLLVRIPYNREKLVRGGKIEDANMLLALEFIRLVEVDYPSISIRQMVSIDTKTGEYLQCELTYKKNPNPFRVRLPVHVSSAKLSKDVIGRLISALEAGLRDPLHRRGLTLTFDNQVVVTPQ